jgi:phage terminase Nu1 subunit (DNA packaging protein)
MRAELMARSTVDTTALAELFDITPRYVRKLVAEGILFRARSDDGQELMGRFELAPSVKRYVQFLRHRVAGLDDGETEYRRHRTSLMAAQAERARLDLEAFKSTLHRFEDVQAVFAAIYRHIRGRARECALRSARRLSENPKPQDFNLLNALITEEIESCLTDISQCASVRETDSELLAYTATLRPEKPVPVSANGENGEDARDV